MINKTSTGEKIFLILLSTAIAIIVSLIFHSIFDTKAKREKREAVIYLNSIIQERDQTIKILRDSLALDSVLIISGSSIKIKSDSIGDSLIVSMGNIKIREWKRK